MSERQKVTVEVDAGEMFGSQSWDTTRGDIDEHGALHIADGFGVLGLKINGNTAAQLHLHEDRHGYVVLDVVDGHTDERLARIDVELYGMVPPRRGNKGRKDRRFEGQVLPE